MESRAAQLDRLDRHVERSYLRISDGVSHHRAAYSLEEALRLAVLPGEEEGRIYCFRRISLTGIPERGSRQLWIDQVQRVLGVAAARAVHGSDTQADLADAVYFHNREEALETLLRKSLRALSGNRQGRPAWFHTSVLGIDVSTSYTVQIPAILECLRQPPLSAGAAPSIILEALGSLDPAALLDAVPPHLARTWVRELDTQRSFPGDTAPIQLPDAMSTVLRRAAGHFGWKDPRTVWLAAIVMIRVSPSALSGGTVAGRARSTLRLLEIGQTARTQDHPMSANTASAGAKLRSLVFDDDAGRVLPPSAGTADSAANRPFEDAARPSRTVESVSSRKAEAGKVPTPIIDDEADTSDLASLDHLTTTPALLGEPTSAAGLYFVLQVLRRLGISATLEACPSLVAAGFVEHILKRLASEAGVKDDDPILLCLHPKQPEFVLSPEILSALPLNSKNWPAVWPNNLPLGQHRVFGSRLLLRTWTVAVKLWCWRTGRLTLPEIVNRKGHVWLTRTDLDVTVPLASVDVRVRRIGLDIDPGWLPWFGEFGRVVRFHYRDREPVR